MGAIGILCDTKVITLGRIWTYVELGAFLAALFAFVSGMRKIKDKFFSLKQYAEMEKVHRIRP